MSVYYCYDDGGGDTLDVGEPVRLVVVLGGDGERVEEHQDDHQPVEGHRLDGRSAFPATEAVPAPPLTTGNTNQCVRTHSKVSNR